MRIIIKKGKYLAEVYYMHAANKGEVIKNLIAYKVKSSRCLDRKCNEYMQVNLGINVIKIIIYGL